MKTSKFISGASITFTTRLIQMGIGLAASVIIARILGPEGKGIYALAILFPTMIIRFADVGIEPATTYHVAQKQYSYKEILGSNVLISLGLSMIGVFAGLIVVLFFSDLVFADVPQEILLFSLILVPTTMLLTAVNQINMGALQFAKYNMTLLCLESTFLSFLVFSLLLKNGGIVAALSSRILGYVVGIGLVLFLVFKYSGGIILKFNRGYVKKIFHYGFQAYLGNLIAFLNLRIDLLIINHFMNTKEVGYYSISVGLAEKLWMVSSVISVVLFPLVASEKEEKKKKEFTPRVTRAVFFFNSIGYLLIFALGSWFILLLYTDVYSPAIAPLRILIFGALPLSVSKVLSSDIAGRGKPIINTIMGGIVLVINVTLNLILIPSYGIIGAAWATSISYIIHFVLKVGIYCRISGNKWKDVLIPKKTDIQTYWSKAGEISQGILFRLKKK